MQLNLLNVDARIEQKCCLMVIESHLYNNVLTMGKLIPRKYRQEYEKYAI